MIERILSRNPAVEERELQVMCELAAIPEITQRELARRLGVSLGAINFCINALIDKGFVKMNNFKLSKNKMGYVYLLTPKGLSQKSLLAKHFLSLKLKEYKHLQKEIEMLKVLVLKDRKNRVKF
jgi:EPS-associated MarR family transcriptional regulator